MNIEQMHVTFREMAQQMGMQTVRAILSEDIDICINFAIRDFCARVINENVTNIFSDKVSRQNAKITPINALRTIYTHEDVTNMTGNGTEVNPYVITHVGKDKVMHYQGFQVSYNGNTIYDCRLIEADRLGQTIRDFCNRPAKDAPIAVVYGDTSDEIEVHIFTGRRMEPDGNPPRPQLIRILYFREPAMVRYEEDDVGARVDCDLPSFTHSTIINAAVQYYLTSIAASQGRKGQAVES